MPDTQREREYLVQVDRHMAEGERRLAEQIALVEQMTEKGQDTTEARKLLRNFEQTLASFRDRL